MSLGSQDHTPGRAIFVATSLAVFAVMPVYLLGAQATFIRAEMGLDAQTLGVLIAAFFLTSAVASTTAGRIVERIRARRSTIAALSGSSLSLLLMGLVSRSWLHILLLIIFAAIANGLAHPAASLLLRQGAENRQGLGFGWKQSAVPLSTLAAGLAVPLVALQVGWRWAFIGAAVVAAAAIITVPHDIERTTGAASGTGPTTPDLSTKSLVTLSIGAGLAVGAGVSLGTFMVDYAVFTGWDPGHAGLLLAGASLAGGATRLSLGYFADRRPSGLLTSVSRMLLFGSLGYLLLGLSSHPLVVVIGATIAYAAGWGWNGLLLLAVNRTNLNAPAAATGIVQAGLTAGAAIGPITLGAIQTRVPYQQSWLILGGAVLASSLGVRYGRDLIRREIRDTETE